MACIVARMRTKPMVLEPILKPKVWGGRRLAAYGKALPEEMAHVGESWEVADLDATSPDGGGGGEARSRIATGEARGLTIRDAVRAMGANLMGRTALTEEGEFPLLVKYLDAADNLSVQVHPSPQYAGANPGCHLKTETWLVLDATPGSVVYSGLKEGTTAEGLVEAIKSRHVEDVMRAVPARVGDVHHLPSGTVHALGAGCLVAEVQSPSDTTFRLFDWQRTDRTLHVEQAMACLDFESSAPGVVRSEDRLEPGSAGVRRGVIESNELYELVLIRGEGGFTHELDTSWDAPVVLMFTAGDGWMVSAEGEYENVAYHKGDTALVPARLDSVVLQMSRDTSCLMVRCRESGCG